MKLQTNLTFPPQLLGEPDKWYSLFIRYLELGPRRSLVDLQRELSKSPKATKTFEICTIKKMAARYYWTERAEAWDKEEALKQAEQSKPIQEQIIHRAMEGITIFLEILKRILVSNDPSEINPHDMRILKLLSGKKAPIEYVFAISHAMRRQGDMIHEKAILKLNERTLGVTLDLFVVDPLN